MSHFDCHVRAYERHVARLAWDAARIETSQPATTHFSHAVYDTPMGDAPIAHRVTAGKPRQRTGPTTGRVDSTLRAVQTPRDGRQTSERPHGSAVGPGASRASRVELSERNATRYVPVKKLTRAAKRQLRSQRRAARHNPSRSRA